MQPGGKNGWQVIAQNFLAVWGQIRVLETKSSCNKKQLPNGWGCCTINLWAATFLQVATLEATFLCPTDCTHSQIDWGKFAIKHRLIYESRQIINTEEHLLFCKTCVMVAATSVDLFKQEGRCERSARMLAKSFHCLELHILLFHSNPGIYWNETDLK